MPAPSPGQPSSTPSQQATIPGPNLPNTPAAAFSQPAAGPTGDAADGKHDSTAAERKFEQQPWFAKLPPSLKKAIRASVRRDAPRGYEEISRRYFQSKDP